MSTLDFIAILPLLILSGAATLVMLQIAFWRNVQLSSYITVISFALAAYSCISAEVVTPRLVTPLLQADGLAILFSALFCLAGLVTTILSLDYMKQRGEQPEEYYLLLLLSTLGACVLTYAEHLASMLLGMELLSVALYALIAYPDKTILPLEAAIKYLVLSGAASATTLFGFALMYSITGTLAFTEIGNQLATQPSGNTMLLVSMVLILAGLGFKLSLVPFHMWTPDVYQGAPSPITGFLASVSKAAIFIALLRWFLEAKLYRYNMLLDCMSLVAILSMLAGNWLALRQENIKRMLSYSSIAHIGYLLVILIVCGSLNNRGLAVEAAAYYLVAYTATTLAAFGLLSLISAHEREHDNAELHNVDGLFWSHPLYACLMMVALLSLAGIPLTAGFIAKFYIFNAAVSGSHWWLISALVIGSSLGIYYYLRVIFAMSKRSASDSLAKVVATGMAESGVSCALIASILILGILPQALIEYLRSIL